MDRELSRFEQRLLEAHLDHCAECAGFAATVAHVTDELRAAPPEVPVYPIASALPRGGRMVARARTGMLSAAAAAAVVLGILQVGVNTQRPSSSQSAAPLIVVAAPSDDRQFLRMLQEARRDQLVGHRRINVEPFRPGVRAWARVLANTVTAHCWALDHAARLAAALDPRLVAFEADRAERRSARLRLPWRRLRAQVYIAVEPPRETHA